MDAHGPRRLPALRPVHPGREPRLGVFLLSVLLVSPPLPWAPTPPGAVGHYLFINLYVIEMVALFVLASLPTGQWFGLDALVHYVFGPRRRAVPAAAPAKSAPGRSTSASVRR